MDNKAHNAFSTSLPPGAGPFRYFSGESVFLVIAVTAFLFHMYTALFGLMSATVQRSVHWWLFGTLLFLTAGPARHGRAVHLKRAVDVLCILALAAASIYLILNWRALGMRIAPPGTLELVCGGALILATLEAARRTSGVFLPGTALVFIAYAMAGPYMPGLLKHKGYSLSRIISYLYTTSSGIYGIPMGVCATFIVLFVFFGAFLNVSGASRLLLECSMALTGRFMGGAAKTAVVASALMGTMSGSSIANAVTTGTITIPMMRKSGFDKNVACAVEAVASTGGMIMPPVMGAAAFLMAEYLHTSYVTLIKAAFLPALVYFISIYFTIDFYARKHNIGGSRDQATDIRGAFLSTWHLLIPIAALIWFLMRRYSPMASVVWSLLLLLAVSWLRKDTRLTPDLCCKAITDGAKNAVSVTAACATAGIILGVIGLTGIGSTMSAVLFARFADFLPGALVACMAVSLVLGMGMPATAVYLILATVAAPSLIKLGVTPLAAHMFVFYFGIISSITPPVALTAYAAAAVGGGESVRVGVIAFVFGIAAYCIPFVLVYAPEMMLTGGIAEALVRFAISVAAVFAVALAVVGHFRARLPLFCRILAAVAGLLLITPGLYTNLAGFLLLCLILVMRRLREARAFYL